MSNEIRCPKCSHVFTLNDIMNEEFNVQLKSMKEKLNSEAEQWKKNKEDEFKKELQQTEARAKEKATAELQLQLQSLKEEADKKSQQLSDMQRREIEFMKKQQDMEDRQRNFEMEKEKYFLEKKREIEEGAVSKQKELFDMKLKEKEIQMDSMKKTIDDLKRKSEQGSMQLQGEAQELLLEQLLRENFPGDQIEEVGKGAEGADCIQFIRNGHGASCGSIIFESKRTKNWSNGWIEKLKADMRSRGADVAVLVTQAYPKDMTRFGQREGVWICSFQEFISVSTLLRHALISVYETRMAGENKGDKMHMLYDYLTGNEFRGQVEAIAEGFRAMKDSITKERIQMEKLWKEREKQLEKVLLNTTGLYGSVKGIIGASVKEIPLLDGSDENATLPASASGADA